MDGANEVAHTGRNAWINPREGVADLFMFFEPLAGKRYVKVTDQRTGKDWAEAMRELADVIYPHAKKIVVVLDSAAA